MFPFLQEERGQRVDAISSAGNAETPGALAAMGAQVEVQISTLLNA